MMEIDKLIKLILFIGFDYGYDITTSVRNYELRINLHNISLIISSDEYIISRSYKWEYEEIPDCIELLKEEFKEILRKKRIKNLINSYER